MTYEEFCLHYDSAMTSAKDRFGPAARGQSVISNGMDKDCEDFILSADYVTADADEIAAAAVAAVDSDF